MEIHVTAQNSPYLLDLSKIDTDNYANSTINILLDSETILNLPPIENVKGCPFINIIANNNEGYVDALLNCAEGDTFVYNNDTSIRFSNNLRMMQLRPMFKNIWMPVIGWNWD